jgi:preprotein translocase subunit SecA
LIPLLKEHEHFMVDEERHAATLTDSGIEKMEELLGVKNIYTEDVTLAHHLDQALKAHALYRKDRDYVVREGEVVIVDQFTGRLMPGRRYSQGLHQAIEAKEQLEVKQESRTLATITIQNYFRMYKKLAGMTGTAATEAEEFHKIYGLHVVQIPTNKSVIRADRHDVIYKTERGKFSALVNMIKEKQKTGQPVLVGTISIEKNELLSKFLTDANIKHEILNAKNHEREAEIIAQAGKKGAVTVATNMAGRGVDIVLGGNPCAEEEAAEVKRLGGLCVIGSERHEARRIDNQLRGRSGRQGDPGESQFFISLEDDLMRIFGSQRIKSLMDRLGLPEDMPIENRLISRSIEKAQQKVEGYHFDTRKHLVEYDDVINKQRTTIYKRRNDVLTLAARGESLEPIILQMIKGELQRMVNAHGAARESLKEALAAIPLDLGDQNLEGNDETAMVENVYRLASLRYQALSSNLPKETKQHVEKVLLLRAIDTLWVDHLDAIDYLRTGIGLQGYGQRDPLVEYKREAFSFYQILLREIEKQVAYNCYKILAVYQKVADSFEAGEEKAVVRPLKTTVGSGAREVRGASSSAFDAGSDGRRQNENEYVLKDRHPQTGKKIGRNDPCFCGSGRKYKRCHGA